MRILYYNWVDYLDDEKRGGGVTVYQRNVLSALENEPEVEAAFLSSGISYDLRARAPRWEKQRHGPKEAPAIRYEIVNSGVLSPAHHSFGAPSQVSDTATTETFMDFLEKTGPWDVVHFNNLEGLPADVLRLKERFPKTRVILSLHNYYPICPQVNLWQKERQNCPDFRGGDMCLDCLTHTTNGRLVRMANAMAFRLKKSGIRPGTRLFDLIFRNAMRLGSRGARAVAWARRGGKALPAPEPVTAVQARGAGAAFGARRARMIDAINAGCDRVLCVSDRVRQIAAHHGVQEDILETSYIGTVQAEAYQHTQPRPSLLRADGTLGLGYLGYMRRDKGFFFLLDALEALPDDLAARLHLLAAARTGPPELMRRLEALEGRLASLTHVDGYGHDELDDLLAQVDVGLVPVMWEDNLPQVAIEMHARHIPLLTSDLGGAQELGKSADMTFCAGDTESFARRIAGLLDEQVDMGAYWAGAQAPVTMPEHVASLMSIYES